MYFVRVNIPRSEDIFFINQIMRIIHGKSLFFFGQKLYKTVTYWYKEKFSSHLLKFLPKLKIKKKFLDRGKILCSSVTNLLKLFLDRGIITRSGNYYSIELVDPTVMKWNWTQLNVIEFLYFSCVQLAFIRLGFD